MEDELVRIRRRVPRKRTIGARLKKALEMPHVSRAKRNQRVVIVAMVVLMGVYLLVAPLLSDMFGGGRKEGASPAAGAPTSPPPHAIGKKK